MSDVFVLLVFVFTLSEVCSSGSSLEDTQAVETSDDVDCVWWRDDMYLFYSLSAI